MASAPPGFDTSSLTPFFGVKTSPGVGVRSAPAPRFPLLYGNMLVSAIARTVGATNYNTAAGTATPGTVSSPNSPEEADAMYGQGSELALDYRAAYKVQPGAQIKCVVVAEAGGAAKAAATVLFAGPATNSGVVQVTLAGQKTAEVSIASGDAATAVATAVAHAINKVANFPATATVASATVTVTAKQGGTRGNNLGLGVSITAPGVTAALNGGSAGMTPTARLAGGTGTDDITAAIAAAAPGEYAYHVLSHVDATNIDLLRGHLNTGASIAQRKRQQGIFALTSVAYGAAIAFAGGPSGRNAGRLECVYLRDATAVGSVVDPIVKTSGEIAAAQAMARLWGDSNAGGQVEGELAYAACNLDGVHLDGILAPTDATGVRFLDSEVEQLLQGGVTPLVASPSIPGIVRAVRVVTTYTTDSNGNPTNAVKDASRITIADYAAERLENLIAATFRGKNIAPDPEDPNLPPPNARVTFPRIIRAVVANDCRAMEREGYLVDVEKNMPALSFTQDSLAPSNVYGSIPAACIPHLHVVAADLQQIA